MVNFDKKDNLDNHLAYIILNMIPGIGSIRIRQILSIMGEPIRILHSNKSQLVRIPGIGEELASRLVNWREIVDLEAELKLVKSAGIEIMTLDSDDYPPLLREIHDPPICLYIRGDRSILKENSRMIAVVGSRNTTRYGSDMARHLSAAASLAGWIVVSGLARGIDTEAHDATIKANGKTIAVLGGGLGKLFPQENIELAIRIVESGGAVISEFPIMFPPDKRTFPMRNRIISGLSRGTIVIEAGLKSGSLITANQALDQGRTVFAVPGRADAPLSRGCNQLIREGAVLVEDFSDILQEFTGLNLKNSLQQPKKNEKSANKTKGTASGKVKTESVPLTDFEREIVKILDQEEMSIDMLVASLQAPAHRVLSSLVALEIKRVIRQLPGRRICLEQARIPV